MSNSDVIKKRQSSGYFDVGTEEDGAVVSMETIGDILLIIKEKAVYEVISADTIDPKRENIHLPAMIPRLIISQGVNSPLVGSTVLTAKNLFGKVLFENKQAAMQAIKISLEILEEFAVLDAEVKLLTTEINNEISNYDKRREAKEKFVHHVVQNLETRCRTIFQKMDQILHALMAIVNEFFQSEKKIQPQASFETLQKVMSSIGNTQFADYIETRIDFIKMVRGFRNCLDHRLSQYCKVRGFEIQPDSSINAPTIEMDYRESQVERVDISELLEKMQESLLALTENMMAHIAITCASPGNHIQAIKEIPMERRQFPTVKLAFWMNEGSGGYFYQ